MASADAGGCVKVWDLRTGAERLSAATGSASAAGVVYDASGQARAAFSLKSLCCFTVSTAQGCQGAGMARCERMHSWACTLTVHPHNLSGYYWVGYANPTLYWWAMTRARRPRPTSNDPAGPGGGHSRRAGGLPQRRQRRRAGSAAGARGRRAGGVVQRARALIDGRGRHGQVLGIAAGGACRGWPWHVQRRPHRAQHARSCMRAAVCLSRPPQVMHV